MSGLRFVCAYTYEDADGREVFQHVRYRRPDGDKTFRYRWRTRPGWVWHWGLPNGGRDLIYRLPEILDTAGQTAHWCEGEKDADAVRAAGAVATSHHGGAGHVTLGQARWLLRARRVVIWMDRDRAAPEVGAYDAALRHNLLVQAGFPSDHIRVVRARGRRKKDAADHLRMYPLRDAAPVDLAWLAETAGRYEPASAERLGY